MDSRRVLGWPAVESAAPSVSGGGFFGSAVAVAVARICCSVYGFAEMPAVRLLSAVSHALLSFISPSYTRPDSFGTYLDDT